MSDSEDDGPIAQDGQKNWDQNLEPLMKVIIGKKGVKVKDAAEVGKKKVSYFRGKDLTNLLQAIPYPALIYFHFIDYHDINKIVMVMKKIMTMMMVNTIITFVKIIIYQ